MKSGDLYKSGYSFAKESEDRKIKILKIVSLLVPLIIVAIFVAQFVSGLSFFGKSTESVKEVFNEKQQQAEIDLYQQKKEAYQNYKIPYVDPQNRFTINFTTPYVSDKVGVVINTRNDYDKVKNEADKVIENAKANVKITTVTYINNF